MKKCKYCAEEIQDEAIKCKHCKEWLGQSPRRPENQIDVRTFIDDELARARHIAEHFTPQIGEAFRARGFQQVAPTCDSLASIWRLEMAKAPPFPTSEDVNRVLTEVVEHLRYITGNGS